VRQFGAQELADELRYHRSAIYHWIHGSAAPYPRVARRIVAIADERGFIVAGTSRRLSMDDVLFGQREAVERIRVR